MKELVMISGKGGTGKTTVTASFAALASETAVLVDCDVDAADLHLVLSPRPIRSETFSGGGLAVIDPKRCTRCGRCAEVCRFGAIERGEDAEDSFEIEALSCEGCGVCPEVCPAGAIRMEDRAAGDWYVSETRHGMMVHARLAAGGENSGKLVSRVREEAKKLAEENGLSRILVDGPPGIGCPVIASVTGASAVLVVAEPTVSGWHDLERVARLAGHFEIPTFLCVNRWDVNPETAERLEHRAAKLGVRAVGRVRYDKAAFESQVEGLSVIELGRNGASNDIRAAWENLSAYCEF